MTHSLDGHLHLGLGIVLCSVACPGSRNPLGVVHGVLYKTQRQLACLQIFDTLIDFSFVFPCMGTIMGKDSMGEGEGGGNFNVKDE